MAVRQDERNAVAARFLDELLEELVADWREDTDLERDVIEDSLRGIVAWLKFEVLGFGDSVPVPEGPVLTRRLADVLGAAILRRFRPGGEPDAVTCLSLMKALDALGTESIPEGARDFASRLADPDGFELVAELAHDLRSPLTSISFLAETLRSGYSGEVSEVQRSQLGLIYSASVALTSLVMDVVDLAQGAGDRLMEDEPRAFSIESVCDSVRDLVLPLAEEKDLDFRIRIEAVDRRVGHPGALGRILVNLVINGLKFADHGWVEVAAADEDGDRVTFSVRDTGRGINEENQRRLFQPFRRATHRDSSFFSSSGLGLSIVRRLLVSMDSELELETREHWGTRFHFTLDLPVVENR